MIRLNKRIDSDNGTRIECETIEDAIAAFSIDDHKIIIARCSTDEECLGLLHGVMSKSKTASEKGLLDQVTIWTPNMQSPDGDGWRLIFEQAEALTAKGIAKQQQLQAQQQAQAQAAMQRMMGGGGGMPNGMMGKRR